MVACGHDRRPSARLDSLPGGDTMSTRPIVVHPEEGTAGPATPGLEMRHLFDRDGRWAGWAGWIRNEAGKASSWHHHAANDTYVYIIRGSLTTFFGPGGTESVV